MNRLRVELDKNKICSVYLNRPDKLNAFDSEMIQELSQTFEDLKSNADLRLVILRGEGFSFCSGADLDYMRSMAKFSMQENLEDSRKLFQMFLKIRQCPVPVLAKVHGKIFGGGLGLLAAADLGFAVEGSQFCFSEVRLGLVPAVISPFVMSKLSPAAARDWMMFGDLFSASEAESAGLVRRVGTEAEVEEWIKAYSKKVLQIGPEAVRKTKTVISELEDINWAKLESYCSEVISQRRVSAEGQEGLASFFAKRTPSWTL